MSSFVQTRMLHPTSGMMKPFDIRVKHDGIKCDICDTTPIVGTRFKCQQCPDFDLCQSCFDSNHHNVHIFSAYRMPI